MNEGSYFNVAVTAARDDDRVCIRIVDADIFRVAEDTGQAEGDHLGLTAAVTLT